MKTPPTPHAIFAADEFFGPLIDYIDQHLADFPKTYQPVRFNFTYWWKENAESKRKGLASVSTAMPIVKIYQGLGWNVIMENSDRSEMILVFTL